MTDATPLASEQITQEDREAAISTVPDDGSHSSYMMVDAIERGAADDWPLVQAFARHRIAALSATPAPSDQDASQAQGEVPKSWEPIASAPRNRETITVLVPLKDGGLIEGAAYFDPDAYDGTWWWDGTSNADYFTDPISECNHGDPIYWLLDSNTGVQASPLGIMTDQPVSIAATRPAPGATAQDGEYTAAASNEAFLDAIHKATPTGQWIAVQHAPDGSGWSVALNPLPWLPGGEVAVKTTSTIPAGMVAEALEALIADVKNGWGDPHTLRNAEEALAAAPKQAEQQGVERMRAALQEIADMPDNLVPTITVQGMRNVAGFALIGGHHAG